MYYYTHQLDLCLIHSIQNYSVVSNFFDTVQSLNTYLLNGHVMKFLWKFKQIKT